MEEDSIVRMCKVEDQVIRRANWNTWIVICSIIVAVAVVLFIEHHIRGLMVHSGVLR
jgi:ATP/ADP translocase